MVRVRCVMLVAALGALMAGCCVPGQPETRRGPKNVILMIPDGMGPGGVTLTRLTKPEQSLAMDPYLVGASITHSEDRIVTDSAAAGTAIASGTRTLNGAVGVDSQGRAAASVLEAAKLQRRMAAGLVVTCRLTDATPAAFTSHVPDRGEEWTIADQQGALGVDLMFGGGRQYFLPNEAGGNLSAERKSRGTTVVRTAEELGRALRLPVLGLFADGDMRFDIDRNPADQPSLAQMTRRALELLSSRPEGFFLLVEGSGIDDAAHANDAAAMVREILAFEEAFAAAVEFARKDGQTLVVSLADHDTGGMAVITGRWDAEKPGPMRLSQVKTSLAQMSRLILEEGKAPVAVLADYAGVTDATEEELAAFQDEAIDEAGVGKALARIISKRLGISWASGGHSATDVAVYAFGPGSGRFRGAHPHTRIARTIAELLGLNLPHASSRMADRLPQMPTQASQPSSHNGGSWPSVPVGAPGTARKPPPATLTCSPGS